MDKKHYTVKELEELEEKGVEIPVYRYIFAEIREGASDEEIMRKYGGMRLYLRQIDKLTHHKIWLDYNSGERVKDIAKKYGITEMLVYQIIKEKRKNKQKKYNLEQNKLF